MENNVNTDNKKNQKKSIFSVIASEKPVMLNLFLLSLIIPPLAIVLLIVFSLSWLLKADNMYNTEESSHNDSYIYHKNGVFLWKDDTAPGEPDAIALHLYDHRRKYD